MDKKYFRQNALENRASLFETSAEKSAADEKIFENFILSGLLKNIKTILTYVSVRDEADTTALIKYCLEKDFKVAVPRCGKQGKMNFYFIRSLDELKNSSWGIPEPEESVKQLVTDFSEALCIVPGTAFDRNGNRTGYGGGYYDRFLAAHTEITAAGLCYNSLIYDEVPSEPHDISVDYIITEKGSIRING